MIRNFFLVTIVNSLNISYHTVQHYLDILEQMFILRLIQSYFYRTSSGNEIDLILEKGQERIGIELKASQSPKTSRGIHQAMQDLGLQKIWIIAPVEQSYDLSDSVRISTLGNFLSIHKAK